MTRLRFPVHTLPMIFLSAVLATCAGDNSEVTMTDGAPAVTNNVGQVKVVETKIATRSSNLKAAQQREHDSQTH